MAQINKTINPGLETMFLTSSEKYTFLSSSVVRELAGYGSDLSEFVPREIIDEVLAKARREGRRMDNEVMELIDTCIPWSARPGACPWATTSA